MNHTFHHNLHEYDSVIHFLNFAFKTLSDSNYFISIGTTSEIFGPKTDISSMPSRMLILSLKYTLLSR